MQREFPEVPLVGVGAIIIEDSRVVLVKRLYPPLQAEWSIPGGVLEVGERVRDAAMREAREETGLIVEAGELLGVYDRIVRNPEQRVQYHYVLVDFLCRRVAGDLAAASDAAEVRWFTREAGRRKVVGRRPWLFSPWLNICSQCFVGLHSCGQGWRALVRLKRIGCTSFPA